MSNFKDILVVIPQLILLFIPGYLTITICNIFRQECEIDEKNLIIKSIFYSFIIEKTITLLIILKRTIVAIYWNGIKINLNMIGYYKTINKDDVSYFCLLFIFSIILAYFLRFFPESKIGTYIVKNIFKTNLEFYPTVWNYGMNDPKGVWVTAYFDENNIAYMGKLIRYTTNPDSPRKEIYLTNYISFRIDTGKVIEDYSNENDKRVYLDVTSCKRIELSK